MFIFGNDLFIFLIEKNENNEGDVARILNMYNED